MFASDYTVGPAPRSKTTPPRPPALQPHRAYARSPLDEDDLITPPDGTPFEIQIASSNHSSPRSGSQSYFQSDDEDDDGRGADRRLPPLGFSPMALNGKRRMSKGHASPTQASSPFATAGSLSPTSSYRALPTPKAIEPLQVTPTKTGNRVRSSYFPGSPRRSSLAPASSPRQSSPALGFDADAFWAGATPTSEVPAVKPTRPVPVFATVNSTFTESLLGMQPLALALLIPITSLIRLWHVQRPWRTSPRRKATRLRIRPRRCITSSGPTICSCRL